MRREEYIEISKEQYDDMYALYQKLGFTEKQCKKLCSSCFGAEIRVKHSAAYREDWTFWRQEVRPPVPEGFFGKLKGKPFMGGMASVSCAEVEDGVCFERAMAMPDMAAPLPAAMTEFNTAETHTAPEIENATPLDRPQLIFSANVNTASWSYVRSKISTGRRIDGGFVRIEEIINSYPYKLKKPENEELFSVSIEQAKCPWNQESELLFVGLKGKKADKKVKQNLAFLVDVSGSMCERWVLVQMSLMAVISKLGKGDIMSIIAYSDETVTVAEKMECSNMDKCIKAVMSIDGIGGCTNGSEGLENAYTFLSENYDKDANNRLFIFTDGDFNFGITSEGGLSEYILKKRETGIYLSVVGYGMENFKDNKMEALARNGNGNYTLIANPGDILDNLWKKLISNLVTVAKDVKISVELNPYYVKEYRLVGYDARVLTQKEFNDTEKAVDGIGSGHNVVALVELKKGTAVKTYSTRYVQSESAGNKDEFAFIEIHYKTPEDVNSVMTHTVSINDLKKAKDKNIHTAAFLAAFGLYIKDSQYKGDIDIPKLKEMLNEFDNDEIKDKYGHFEIIRKYVTENQ